MKRATKILALLMALLMLLTMSVACKQNENELNGLISGNQSANESGNGSGNDGSGTADQQQGAANNGQENAGNNGNGNAANTGNDDVIDQYEGTKKYDMVSNPLLAEKKQLNTGTAPSYDIDTTGFVKNGIKLADLKGKTLTLITALDGSFFYYRGPNGEKLTEWDWFNSLKKTHGLNLKVIESRFNKAPTQIVTYMNSGKALDVIPTHRAGFPQYFMLGRALDPYVNINYINNSPGVDNRTLEQTKWDNTYRCIAPIGAVDVIWYNESMVQALNLKDPHTLWEQNKWDWNAFKEFQVSVPRTNLDGKTMTGFAASMPDLINFFPRTNGVDVFAVKTEGGKTKLISNFNDQRSTDAMVYVGALCKDNDWIERRASEDPQQDMYTNGTCIMSSTLHLMGDYTTQAYAKNNKYNWVPYPKGPGTGGDNVAMNYGSTMMLPKKTKNEANIPYAVKFMEFWANRYTEAIYDYLKADCYDFSYDELKEYFNFATTHNYFEYGSSVFDNLNGNDKEYFNRFRWSFYQDKYNTVTTMEELRNLVQKAVDAANTFAS